MEQHNTHNTHNLSCSSSEDQHSYKLGNSSSSKVIPSDDNYLLKKEEENDWSDIISNNCKEIKSTMAIDNELFNTDMYNKQKNSDKNDNKRIIFDKNHEKNKLRLKTFSKNNEKIEIKEKKVKKENKKQKEEYKENQQKKEKKKSREKREKVKEEKKENKEQQEKQEKKQKDEKYRILNNGIVIKKITQLKDNNKILNNCSDNNNNNINTIKEKKIEESQNLNNLNENNNNMIKEKTKEETKNIINLDSKNDINIKEQKIEEFQNMNNLDENNDNIRQIKKPSKIFITKCYFHKNKEKNINDNNHNNNIQLNQNINIFSMDDKKEDNKEQNLRHSFSSIGFNRQITKSKSTFLSKNENNNIDKFEEKIAYLSNKSPKKFCISNSHLFFNSRIYVRKRPLSSIIIKKEIDFNVRSSKNDNSFNNKSFNSLNVQRIYPLSSFTNFTLKNNLSQNRKEIMYENKYFFSQLKELKNAFELSDNNIDIKINKHKHIFSEISNRNKNNNHHLKKDVNCHEKNNTSIPIKKRIKNHGKENNTLYPSPLFFEFSNINNNNNFMDELENNKNNCCKYEYKKHFGSEKKCPICISRKEDNKLMERQLSNSSYYFPFKNKFSNNNSMHNSFKKKSKKKYKIKYMDYNSLIDFVNQKKEVIVPEKNYYNPFVLNKINADKSKKNKTMIRVNSVRHIKRDKNRIQKKYKALQAYFD